MRLKTPTRLLWSKSVPTSNGRWGANRGKKPLAVARRRWKRRDGRTLKTGVNKVGLHVLKSCRPAQLESLLLKTNSGAGEKYRHRQATYALSRTTVVKPSISTVGHTGTHFRSDSHPPADPMAFSAPGRGSTGSQKRFGGTTAQNGCPTGERGRSAAGLFNRIGQTLVVATGRN